MFNLIDHDLDSNEASLLAAQEQRASFQFQKEKTALKYFLIGRGYHLALKALGFAERYHVGKRKDGRTPELHHQIQIALSITELKDVKNEELCIVGALLHDVQEDYNILSEEIEKEFGPDARRVTWVATKKFAGEHKNKEDFILAVALDQEGSIVKGEDRVNNLQSMIGVFTLEKMVDYVEEAETVFLPMLKKASKLFPEQQMAYYAIMQKLKQLIKSNRAYVQAATMYQRNVRELELAKVGLQTASQDYDKLTHQVNDRVSKSEKLIAGLTKELNEARDRQKLVVEHYLMSCRGLDKMRSIPDNERDNIKEEMRKSMGISTLELYQFNQKVTGDINQT